MRYQSIGTCLTGEVELPFSLIRRQALAMKYPEKVEHRPDRITAVRYPEKVGCRPDIIAVVRHPDKVERWADPDVRYPGGMSTGKNSGYEMFGWNERCHVSQGRGSHTAIFREDPTMPPFISPVWPGQTRWYKNVTFTKFLFHW